MPCFSSLPVVNQLMNASLELGHLPRFRHGLVANLAGSAWSTLMQLVCVPLYIRFLGIEAFGLIGFYLMSQAVLQVLDLGLSPTINREMARYSVQSQKGDEARDLVRTLELGYWLIGILISAALVAASPWVATHWIKSGSVPVSNVREAVMLIGVLALFQWPVSFYQGGLMGLGRQVLYNGIVISFSTLSNVGAVLILWRVSPTIRAFFLWLVATSAVKTFFFVTFLWKSLPSATRPSRFDFKRVRSIASFAAGMSGITASALVLTQSDKVILSKVFSLRVFGYYTIAGMFGAGLVMVASSVFNAIYPRLSALVAQGDEDALLRLYHEATQLMAVLILPLAAVLAFFSTDILQMWTGNADVARHAGPIATLLVIGSALNGLMNLPYSLQLAYGWTSIGLRIAIFLAVVFVPATWFMATKYGAVGAASVWAVLNCVYMMIGVPLTHRRLLQGEAQRWLGDIAMPLVPVLFIVVVGRALVAASMSQPGAISAILLLLFCATSAAALVSSSIRHWLVTQTLRPVRPKI
jgi:O-antigen/teichoic acid export membrane protein